MKELFTVKEEGLKEIGESVLNTLASSGSAKAKVLFLEGDLGAGKTTFTKAVASLFGLPEEDVHSPTFILKKEYKGDHPFFKKLIHIDAYRFEDKEEAKVLKLENDLEDPTTLVVIEWPSKMGGMVDEDMTLSFTIVDDSTREIAINYVYN